MFYNETSVNTEAEKDILNYKHSFTAIYNKESNETEKSLYTRTFLFPQLTYVDAEITQHFLNEYKQTEAT